MNFKQLIFFLLFLTINSITYCQIHQKHIHNFRIEAPKYIIGEQFAEITFEALTDKGLRDSTLNGKQTIIINNNSTIIDFINGLAFFTVHITTTSQIPITIPETDLHASVQIKYLPPWLSIIPPLMAILLALITKEVIISLFVSIFLGVLILKGFNFYNVIPALLTVLDTYILESLNNKEHLSVLIFSFLIGGMVAVISQNGGMKGIVNQLSKYATSPRRVQLITFFLSFGIFYDNYANTLIVGNTMQPVMDKFKVSREKLAFIVHGSAASITAVAFITTWIGAELGYINDATSNLGIDEKTYSLFLKSLQFSFYPILMLFFIFFLIILKKDYGPMNLAEIESRNAGVIHGSLEEDRKKNEDIGDDIKMLEPKQGRRSWLNAFIPLVAMITVAFAGLIITGAENSYEQLLQAGVKIPNYSFPKVWEFLRVLENNNQIGFFHKVGMLIGNSDFYIPLLWSSFAGITFAILATLTRKGISIRTTMENLVQGFRIMLSAVIILVFAWALAEVIKDLHTSDYITSMISSSFIYPQLLPVILFIIAALFSFGIGSIWGSMAILYPLLLPVSWIICIKAGMSPEEAKKIIYEVISVIIAGSVLGNHCSPISDTTIVSSISSNCDHITHIKTQVPYALTVAGVSLALLLFSFLNLHWSLNYLIGISLVFLIVRYFGKTIE